MNTVDRDFEKALKETEDSIKNRRAFFKRQDTPSYLGNENAENNENF